MSVAWRIAAEERSAVGDEVGYSIRFDDTTSPATVIKLMTDGILLTEARGDPALDRYDIVMVDEFTPQQVKQVAAQTDRPLLEVSGGISLDTIRAYAEAGVERISIGALTHSAPALDLSMRVEPIS